MPEQIKQPTPAASEKEIKHIEVAELEAPSERIIEQIQGRIEKEEYGIIIGDDVSGRIPTLIIGGLIRRVTESERKFVPNITFIPGGLDRRHAESEQFLNNLKEFLNRFGYRDGKKVLIVTDTVKTGNALHTLTMSLSRLDIKYDVATIGIEDGDEPSPFPLADMFSGKYTRRGGSHTPLIYKNKSMSGVEKEYYKAESSKRMENREWFEKESENIQDLINKSKADVKILIEKLFAWYQDKYGEQK